MNASMLRQTLHYNSRQLTSQMDIYATLSHVLHERPQTPESEDTFGQSLFTLISSDRTCDQAGIPPEYCLCKNVRLHNLPYDDLFLTKHIATFVIDHLNDQLKPFQDKCIQLKLGKVIKAFMETDHLPRLVSVF